MVDDTAFDAMADGQRRRLLVGLLNYERQRVPELSGVSRELVDANEAFLEAYLSGRLDVEGANKTLIRTYYVHIPKLSEYGFVEWDRDAGVLRRGVRFDDVRPLVELWDDSREDETAKELITT